MDLSGFLGAVESYNSAKSIGKIEKIVGMTIESRGPMCNIGDVCRIYGNDIKNYTYAEVVGFSAGNVLLMPYADIEGIGPGNTVDNTGEKLMVKTGESLVGRIIDPLGRPLDGGEPLEYTGEAPINGIPVNPLLRPKIAEPIEMGVKAIDGLMTLGKGQRIGIFAGSGVGKSTLMGMIARKVKADLNVIALVGERGREVREFIENDLGDEGMARSCVVVATSDQPAMMRNKCPLTATAIAEYFMRQGNDVMLMMDNLTRFAMAQREVGLSIGEPPIARGYTPSIYSALPKLLERAGCFEHGSITGIYCVLVEGDDTNEPISDTVRGIIDGHIILSRKIAAKNHYPSIDVLGSVSRLMTLICDQQHCDAAAHLRNLMALYQKNEDLITIGAYKKGTDAALDNAINKMPKINKFLQQGVQESFDLQATINMLKETITDPPPVVAEKAK
ncbi:flagellum-specific ATP synthase [Clostridia bacterium]|nr:flagellum-specific ATP synthase [Clostridia bacterium]